MTIASSFKPWSHLRRDQAETPVVRFVVDLLYSKLNHKFTANLQQVRFDVAVTALGK